MKYIAITIVFFVFIGCGSNFPIKYYYLVTDPTQQNGNFISINLNDYTFYKREIYYKNDGNTITKDYINKTTDPSKIRYEMQILLIEKKASPTQKVMYFSCYPPYDWYGTTIYDYPFYDDFSVFNIQAINYIMFGCISDNNTIVFNKKKYLSEWGYRIQDGNIIIDNISFKNNGKLENQPTDLLGNIPTYKPMGKFTIVLQKDVREPINKCYTRFLENDTIYFNSNKKQLYFHFNDFLDKDKKYKWLYFKSGRISATLK